MKSSRPYYRLFLSLLVVVLIITELLLPKAFASEQTLREVAFTEAELKQLVGHYSTVFGYIVVHSHKQRGVTQADGKRFYLIKKSDKHIYAVYRLLGLIPISNNKISFTLKQAQGRTVVVLHAHDKKGQPVTEEVGEKFTPVPVSAVWRSRVRHYKVVSHSEKTELKTVRLRLKNHVLVAQINDDTREYPLLPRSDNSAYVPGLGEKQNQMLQLRTRNHAIQLLIGKNTMQLERL